MRIAFRPRTAAALVLLVVLAAFALQAHAQVDSAGLMDTVLDRYRNAAAGWADVFNRAATWLFWTLAVISLSVTGGFMALRKADISEFFAEFMRFIMTIGFFWWILANAVRFSTGIMNGLRQLAAEASGLGGNGPLSPSGVVDIGFDIFGRVVDQSSMWSPVDSAVGQIAAAFVLILLVLVAVNMLLVLIGGWVLCYSGLFYLGFGGGRWTTEMAIGYYRSVLKIGMELMTMVLLVGIGKTFLDDYYANLGNSTRLKDLMVVLVASLILLVLVNRVPPLISSVASGGPIGGSGLGGLGGGALMGAVGMANAAVGMAAALASAGAANAVGGMQALMAAFNAAGSGNGSGGDGGSGGSPGLGWSGGGGGGGGGMGGGGASSTSTPFADAAGFSGDSSGSSSSSGGQSAGGVGSSGGGSGAGNGDQSFGQRMSAVRDQIARGAKVAAQAKAKEAVASFAERVADTSGARIAEAIRASSGMAGGAAGVAGGASSPTFGGDNLSGADDDVFDVEAEVASFSAGDQDAPEDAQPAPGAVDEADMFDADRK